MFKKKETQYEFEVSIPVGTSGVPGQDTQSIVAYEEHIQRSLMRLTGKKIRMRARHDRIDFYAFKKEG